MVQVGRGRMVAAVVVMGVAAGVLAACGGGPGGDGAGSSTPSPGASAKASPTELISTIPTLAPTTPATDEDRINAAADEHGWIVTSPDEDSPAGLVQDVCDTLDSDSADPDVSFTPGQWLATYGYSHDEQKMITMGVPLLCPRWTKTMRSAWAGTYPVWIGAGTFKVTSRRADNTVPPGTYRVKGDLEGCYWERATSDGTIIENKFATAATSMTVTIRSSDDLFTSRDCGVWKPVH